MPKPNKKPQTGTFSLDEVMEAVREDRQKDIDAGREYYPMNEARTRVAAERTEAVTKITIINDNDSRSPTEEASPMEYNELLQAGIDEGILDESAASVEPSVEAPAVEEENTDFWRTRALPTMAPSLEAEAVEIVSLLNDGVNRFVEAGRKLIAHKARIDEAAEDWGLWVAKAFPAFAPRTLGRYMTLARRSEGGEEVIMLPASEDSDESGDLIGLVPPDVSADENDEMRYDPGEDDDASDLRQQSPASPPASEKVEARKQRQAEAQSRRRAKVAEAAGRTVKPRKAKEPATIHVTTRTGSEKAVYDRVMFMVEKAEDEDQLRMMERHMTKTFPELARMATEAGLTGKE